MRGVAIVSFYWAEYFHFAYGPLALKGRPGVDKIRLLLEILSKSVWMRGLCLVRE